MSLLLFLILVAILLAVLLHLKMIKTAKLFARHNPSTKITEYIEVAGYWRNFLSMIFKSLMQKIFPSRVQQHEIVKALHGAKYGSEHGMFLNFMLGKPFLHLYNPELVRQVVTNTRVFPKVTFNIPNSALELFFGKNNLGFTEGEQWKHLRSLMNPTFARLDRFIPIFHSKILEMIKVLEKDMASTNSSATQLLTDAVNPLLMRMTIDILGLSVFNYDFDTVASPNSEYVKAYAYLNTHINPGLDAIIPAINSLPTQHNARVKEATGILNKLAEKLIQEAKQNKELRAQGKEPLHGSKQLSLLDVMVESSDEETGQTLTDAELRDNIMFFFAAGHETTASSLGHALYALAKNPLVQEVLIEEVDTVMKNIVDEYQFEDLQKMTYAHNVIYESLRMYHPSAGRVMPKITSQDTTLDGFFIPKSTLILIEGAIMQYDKAWIDPYTFRPERFNAEEAKKRHSQLFFGFGGGPSKCSNNV